MMASWTNDRLKMLFGFLLGTEIAILIAIVGLGHVEEKTSYGLHDVIIVLAGMSGAWCNWAFGNHNSKEPETKNETRPQSRKD